ncbi:hypothetical protein MNBD_GAMMA12-2605 [hydrothermal vent metagenome]|uniref:VgrG protein n=1 Tax=hydrothermal vent metagenome TaxID=652676 RepID=A0A3B0Z680_9ZZZZ
MHRVLAKDGIFYYFDCETKSDVTQEVIHFVDATSYCSYLKRGLIRYFPTSGMGQGIKKQATPNNEYTSLFTLQDHHLLVTGEWACHDVNDQTPEVKLFQSHRSGTDQNLKNPGKNIQFGDCALSLDEIDRQAKFAAERAKVKAHDVTASGNIADMASGRLISLDASKFENNMTGDYLITQVTHTLDQRHAMADFAGRSTNKNLMAKNTKNKPHHPKTDKTGQNKINTGEQSGPDYRCDLSLIPRDTHYRPELPQRQAEIPMTFTARIESDGRYASLDNQGRYHLRKLLDLGDREHTQAINPPLRRLQPYGGTMRQYATNAEGTSPQSLPTGMHFPLQDGDEVLLSCLNVGRSRASCPSRHSYLLYIIPTDR